MLVVIIINVHNLAGTIPFKPVTDSRRLIIVAAVKYALFAIIIIISSGTCKE